MYTINNPFQFSCTPEKKNREKRMKRQLCRIVEFVAFQVNRYRRLAFSFTFLFVLVFHRFVDVGKREKPNRRTSRRSPLIIMRLVSENPFMWSSTKHFFFRASKMTYIEPNWY